MINSTDEVPYRYGFVAVIGTPNAGKSTLINRMVGSKVSIVSPKVQTTRSIVRGIALHEQSQIVFLDTPGIFEGKKKLERAIVSAAWEGQKDVDSIILVVDVSRRHPDRSVMDLIDKLGERVENVPFILVLNKVDQIRKESLLVISKDLNEKMPFEATFMVSALNGSGVDDLLSYIAGKMPEGEWGYPEDQASDMPARLLAAEITREKLFHYLHQELPYGLTVETESWENFEDGSIKIDQVVFVNRAAHKSIVLGKGGSMIKRIGQESREELEEIMGTRIHLKLFVKVQEKWMDDPERYSLWGLDHRA